MFTAPLRSQLGSLIAPAHGEVNHAKNLRRRFDVGDR